MLFCGKNYRLNTENDGDILLSNYEQLTRIPSTIGWDWV